MATEAPRATELQEALSAEQHTDTCHTTFSLEGMSCASCAMRIEKGLKKVAGVTDVQVNFATEQAQVTYDPTRTGLEQLMQKVEAVGYRASVVDQSAAHSLSA
ncbi:MAG: cation-translocating P-type ATPase, partial [Chloroflexi bacterium]|nr:cation-translocating P-type ATPase [Chloroflexota bacterium]